MARSPSTCLNSEDHGSDIGDHLSHYLGCLDYWGRSKFFDQDNYIWNQEVEHFESLGRTKEDAKDSSDRKRSQWQKDCDNEIRRINFLRQTLKQDEEDNHLVKSIERSVMAWRNSGEYRDNIKDVQQWRTSKGLENGHAPESNQRTTTDKGEYDPEKDISAPIIQFLAGKPKMIESSENSNIFGIFPDQKIKIKHLLAEGEDAQGNRSILHKDYFKKGEITYFHLPSNNMAVSLLISF